LLESIFLILPKNQDWEWVLETLGDALRNLFLAAVSQLKTTISKNMLFRVAVFLNNYLHKGISLVWMLKIRRKNPFFERRLS